MSFLMDWVTQIVLFIFLATIITLLIPKNSHEKTVKLVFGLIIFLLFLHPLTTLFQVEPDEIVSEIQLEKLLQGDSAMEDEIEDKKIEIQASTDAYILEQLEEQVENMVGEELIETYGVTIQSLSVKTEEEQSDEEPEIESITFRLEEKKEDRIEPVENVSIPENQQTDNTRHRNSEIAQTISSLLDLPLQAIEIEWEGG